MQSRHRVRRQAKLLREGGVTRISMGVQSLDEDLLDRLGRVHSRAMVFKSYDILRNAGFERVNLDLMFAIPSQTMPVWQDTLRETIAMQPEHLSCYEVIYEQDRRCTSSCRQVSSMCRRWPAICSRNWCAWPARRFLVQVANFGRHLGGGAFEIPDGLVGTISITGVAATITGWDRAPPGMWGRADDKCLQHYGVL